MTWKDEGKTPYFHWWATVGDYGQLMDEELSKPEELSLTNIESAESYSSNFGDNRDIPKPVDVNNPNVLAPEGKFFQGLFERCEAPPPDAVFTVVIDEAIALGHPRFRYQDGTSRILTAWQQGASFDQDQVDFLPFGQELYQKGINDLLRKHSVGQDTTNALDETAFNREARLSEPLEAHDTRSIVRRAGHGTAVLDLAAGFPAHDVDDAELRRRPIIAINLPRRATIGMAGTFLEFYTIAALRRAVNSIDALWDFHYKSHPGRGFPIVVNISYGQQSGPKDGKSAFEQDVESLQNKRQGRPALEVVMPAGNDNLMRCNARREMSDKNAYFRQLWRVQPEDHSSNFVEVWTAEHKTELKEHPLAITIRAPGGALMEKWRGSHGEYIDVDQGARIYCEKVDRNVVITDNGAFKHRDEERCRFRYVICVPPTADPDPSRPNRRRASAGVWEIELTDGNLDGEVYVQVQVDQSAEPDGQRSRRSYFVQSVQDTAHTIGSEDLYQTHEPNGRPMDTYQYPFVHYDVSNLDAWKPHNHIQRKGTANAIAMNKGIIVVGSFRQLDGRPNDFSATAYPPERSPYPDAVINVSAASDDGAAHLGILAAGAHAGSVVALRGTSFSAPRVSRWLVDHLLSYGSMSQARAALLQVCATAEATFPENWGKAAPAKIGEGRIPLPVSGDKVTRI